MGSVGAGLASIGGSIAQAQDIKRQRRLEDLAEQLKQQELGLKQQQLGTEQEYAKIAGIREQREQQDLQERIRVSKLPKFVGYRVVGGRLYQGIQDPQTGEVKTTEVSGIDAQNDVMSLESEIASAPEDVQPTLRAIVQPYIAAQDYVHAREALKPVMQQYAKNQLPQPIEQIDTTERVEVNTKKGPQIVQFPKHETKQKVFPRAVTSTHPGVAAPTARGVPQHLTAPAAASQGGVTRGGIAAPQAKTRTVDQLHDDLGLPKGAKVLGMKPPSRADVTKMDNLVGDADKRLLVMIDAVKNVTWQNDVALLFNHIGMTLSAQRGARITTAEIQRAISARDIPSDLLALWQKMGISDRDKGFLTPQQRKDMLALGVNNRNLIWQEQWDLAKANFMADRLPVMNKRLPPVQGVDYIGEDRQTRDGKRVRVTYIAPDGSMEVKPY